ncbi:MAG: riboflavin synthase [Deltaproteobacteria bacterium]|nr:riboflavin synthase [Deltaproteobacteria bacterium]
MFTGIIEATGKVKSVEKTGASGRITVKSPFAPGVLETGGSVAVDGVCLTVTEFRDGLFTADVSGETLRLTTLGGLKAGASVNLERPLTPSTPIGGHLVTGHVDCVGVIAHRVDKEDGAEFEIRIPREFLNLVVVVHKGSVAIDGISLTVASVTEDGFKVVLIPHTMKVTAISGKKPGSKVNIETDIIGKYVKRFLSPHTGGGVTEGFLVEHGFIKGE